MVKNLIRWIGIPAVCFLMSVMPVKAAEEPVSLLPEEDNSRIDVILSKENIGDEVYSLQLDFMIKGTQGYLGKNEVSFEFSEDIKGVTVKEQRYGEEKGILSIFISGKEELFELSESDELNLGYIKLNTTSDSTISADKLKTVNGASYQQETPVEGVQAEVAGSDDKKPPEPEPSNPEPGNDDGSNHDNDNNNDSSDNNNHNNNSNNRYRNSVNTVMNPDTDSQSNNISSQFLWSYSEVTEQETPTQNDNSQSLKSNQSGRNTQKEKSSRSDSESVITGTEQETSEESETSEEALSEESESTSADAAEVFQEVGETSVGESTEASSGMALWLKVLIGILAVGAAGAVAAYRLIWKNKKNDE